MPNNPTTRFTDRVDNYVRFRPGYPAELLAELARRAHLSPSTSVLADIGSGTGILTAELLPLASRVYAVEPNAAMRSAAEKQFAGEPRFVSVGAAAEATTLPDHSVDLITAGQSFHWFNHEAARREFARILKPGGLVALIWNERQHAGTPFLEGYEDLLRKYATDYARTRQALVNDATLAHFFAPAPYELVEYPTVQAFDCEGLIGRSLSSSYAPNPGHPGHDTFLAALRDLYARHAKDDRIEMRYQARMYIGKLT